jgi:hypothetical protein
LIELRPLPSLKDARVLAASTVGSGFHWAIGVGLANVPRLRPEYIQAVMRSVGRMRPEPRWMLPLLSLVMAA